MNDIRTPVLRAFVAATLLLATATLMAVALNTARAAGEAACTHRSISCDAPD